MQYRVSHYMRTLHFCCLLILIISLTSCYHHYKRITLTGFADSNTVTYETEKVKFIFPQNSIVEYCNNQDTTIHNNRIFKEIIKYMTKNAEPDIIIPDTLGTIMVRDSAFYYKGKYRDTLLRERNHKNEYAYVTEAFRWTLLDLILNGKLKILDKQSNKPVDYIIVDEIESNSHGEVQILLPNNIKIFQQLRWIQ